MSIHKYIYWDDGASVNGNGEVFAYVHLLVGYTSETIEAFQKMADELRKTFPQATNSEICGGHVIESSSVLNFSIITFRSYLPKREYPGWHQIQGRQAYLWAVTHTSLPDKSLWTRMLSTFSPGVN